MKKQEYVNKISENLNMTKKDVSKVIGAFLDEFCESIVLKDSVTITNVGTFKKEHVVAKNMFSPIDGASLQNDYYRVHFSMSESLSKRIKNNDKK